MIFTIFLWMTALGKSKWRYLMSKPAALDQTIAENRKKQPNIRITQEPTKIQSETIKYGIHTGSLKRITKQKSKIPVSTLFNFFPGSQLTLGVINRLFLIFPAAFSSKIHLISIEASVQSPFPLFFAVPTEWKLDPKSPFTPRHSPIRSNETQQRSALDPAEEAAGAQEAVPHPGGDVVADIRDAVGRRRGGCGPTGTVQGNTSYAHNNPKKLPLWSTWKIWTLMINKLWREKSNLKL